MRSRNYRNNDPEVGVQTLKQLKPSDWRHDPDAPGESRPVGYHVEQIRRDEGFERYLRWLNTQPKIVPSSRRCSPGFIARIADRWFV